MALIGQALKWYAADLSLRCIVAALLHACCVPLPTFARLHHALQWVSC